MIQTLDELLHSHREPIYLLFRRLKALDRQFLLWSDLVHEYEQFANTEVGAPLRDTDNDLDHAARSGSRRQRALHLFCGAGAGRALAVRAGEHRRDAQSRAQRDRVPRHQRAHRGWDSSGRPLRPRDRPEPVRARLPEAQRPAQHRSGRRVSEPALVGPPLHGRRSRSEAPLRFLAGPPGSADSS